jgi:hypothetical protein
MTPHRTPRPLLAIVLPAFLATWLGSGCSDAQATALPAADGGGAPAAAPADAPLAIWQTELLDLAMRSAAKMPLDPHIKNRSRAQEAVVAACLQLDQPARALAGIEDIANWRRGTGYADYALYCAQHGRAAGAQHALGLAQQIADGPADADAQDWQRDRIRAGIARVWLALGRADEAARLGAGVVASEAGKLQADQAALAAAEDFDKQVDALDAILAARDFDASHNALQAFVQLHRSFYADVARRALAEDRIRTGCERLPATVHIDLTLELADSALDHADKAHALQLVDAAQGLVDGATWTDVDHVTLTARLAERRARAGDAEAARKQATAALALFTAQKARIVDIERAGALRAVAEALQASGDTPGALAVYRIAVEEGVQNPNSRPRADDLLATCCSMAQHGVQPDEALWARLHSIGNELGDPW